MFAVGDLVQYSDKLCVISDIVPTHLGFRTYNLTDIDNGKFYNVAKHLLSQVDFLTTADTFTFDDTSDLVPQENIPPGDHNSSRHAVMTDQQIDEVARKRLSEKTEAQTKWAVGLYKGKNIVSQFGYILITKLTNM